MRELESEPAALDLVVMDTVPLGRKAASSDVLSSCCNFEVW